MDVESFLRDLQASPLYKDQIVYLREVSPRSPVFSQPHEPLPAPLERWCISQGISSLYTHQAQALDAFRAGENSVIATGTGSGKSLCFLLPLLEILVSDPQAKALLLFPTKALCQDQFRIFAEALRALKLRNILAGVYDGDTPASARRTLRDRAAVLFTNPDMLHAGLLPQHGRWPRFLSGLRLLVLDELHVYNGMFGSNASNLFRRFFRVLKHYGSTPQVVSCSATIGNPQHLAERITGQSMTLVDQDGSPCGRKVFLFWNPPRIREGNWLSRRSANVEAHELMAQLIQMNVPTITFSKARITAEMIHRYVCDKLKEIAPQQVSKVSPYRGGYLPEERREIEDRLFKGELLGVSTTPALELGIHVAGLDASILVGYPGTLASFFQQAGRAGRGNRDSLVILIGLDTPVNQYILSTPNYIFGRPVEQGVIDPDNPYVITGHLRCAAHELPIPDSEVLGFGPHAPRVLRLLEENLKLRHLQGAWFHVAPETPQHEVSLRCSGDANVVIADASSGDVIGEVDRLDAEPLVHPEAIYLHRGESYRVLSLDLDQNLAQVQPVEVNYYTQPLGGTDVHHIDHGLRQKPFGTGLACWGEVTTHSNTWAYEKIHFYSLDALSIHGLDLPTLILETMAFWIVPPESLMAEVVKAGLDAHAGLRGIGYATRMLLPLSITCDTQDFSHSIGSANSPWNTLFVYERFQHGLGFTEKAYELLHDILPAVLEQIRDCPCPDGCPCCVGKPLRQFTTWNVERGEANIPSKKASLKILEGLLGDRSNLRCPDNPIHPPETPSQASSLLPPGGETTERWASSSLQLDRSLRRRLERQREPTTFHPIEPHIKTGIPDAKSLDQLQGADVAHRAQERESSNRDRDRRIAKRIQTELLSPMAPKNAPPPGTHKLGGSRKPTDFPGRPPGPVSERQDKVPSPPPIRLGDPLAAKARKKKKG